MKIEFLNSNEEAATIALKRQGDPSLIDRILKRRKALSKVQAEDVKMALEALDAADSLYDLPSAYHPHPLKQNRKGQFAIDLTIEERGKFRMVFVPAVPGEFKNGDHKTIRSIRIISLVENYHAK